jgi:hypothetical protein
MRSVWRRGWGIQDGAGRRPQLGRALAHAAATTTSTRTRPHPPRPWALRSPAAPLPRRNSAPRPSSARPAQAARTEQALGDLRRLAALEQRLDDVGLGAHRHERINCHAHQLGLLLKRGRDLGRGRRQSGARRGAARAWAEGPGGGPREGRAQEAAAAPAAPARGPRAPRDGLATGHGAPAAARCRSMARPLLGGAPSTRRAA